jgi:hypothetical protein
MTYTKMLFMALTSVKGVVVEAGCYKPESGFETQCDE